MFSELLCENTPAERLVIKAPQFMLTRFLFIQYCPSASLGVAIIPYKMLTII